MDAERTRTFVEDTWERSILPALVEYIAIPNKSPAFDPKWAEHGHMERAVELIADWCRARELDGFALEVIRLEGRTPVIWMELEGDGDETVLLYGHLDKQPEMVGWAPDLGPWKPVRKGDRLYGRGGADDVPALPNLFRDFPPNAAEEVFEHEARVGPRRLFAVMARWQGALCSNRSLHFSGIRLAAPRKRRSSSSGSVAGLG